MKTPQHLLLVNIGGIGDSLLFSPVIRQLQVALPQTRLTLLVEHRSRAVASLLPAGVDVLTLNVPCGGGVFNRLKTAQALWQALKDAKNTHNVDGVICCGSSPFIAPVLAASGLPFRIGFQSLSAGLLTAAAPLNVAGYAGDMYAELGNATCRALALPVPAVPTHPVIELTDADHQWFSEKAQPHLPQLPWVLVHPGVSRVSIEKSLVKRWAPERWAQCLVELSPHVTPVLVGGPEDLPQLEAIQHAYVALSPTPLASLVGITENLRHLAVCMAHASQVLCCDSAPMHVAVGVNVPITALFGDFPPHRLLPSKPHWQALTETGPRSQPDYIEIPVETVVSTVQRNAAIAITS